MQNKFRSGILVVIMFLTAIAANAQIITLDDFENKNGWSFNQSDGVIMNLSNEKGISGNAIRIDYDFTKGTGFGGIQKLFPLDLPENFEFSFYLKAESPSNNFEIKFIDASGDNVWWVNNRNFEFPTEWKKITIKKRKIGFAWGPTADQSLKRIDRVEFTIASFVGGKGSVWLDNFKFEPLPAETQSYPVPAVIASSSLKSHSPEMMSDGNTKTWWENSKDKKQSILFDFKARREFGGLKINWLQDKYAKSFDIQVSSDGKIWENAYSVASNNSEISFIRLPEAESRYLKINLREWDYSKGIGISEIQFLKTSESATLNDFFMYTSGNSIPGNYPRYFSKHASSWTITGVNKDTKEALINTDGMVEVDKGLFSLEPLIKEGDSVYTWSNVKTTPSMGGTGKTDGFSFIPSLKWSMTDLEFETSVSSIGDPNVNSRLNIRYSFTNLSDKPKDFEFYILVRPFQVNPYYQFLNLTGGTGKIKSIKVIDNNQFMVDDKQVILQKKFDSFGAADFNVGNIVDLIREGKMPSSKSTTDNNGLANAVVKYSIHLDAGQKSELYASVPFYGSVSNPAEIDFSGEFARSEAFWKSKVDHIKFNLPPSAKRIINTYKSNLGYILVNRDKAGIQPGSRSYERSWIRDGALTSSALLKSGIVPEVKEFIEWYAANQFENGKVPCVVDFRGPDPVPENDSHGEFIYLIREYFNFTQDTAFLRSKNEAVIKTVDYIESLIALRSTEHYKNGNDSIRSLYGLVPESISHEGYSAKPMHSYWDDFFTMKGLKDAVEIQKVLGETENEERFGKLRDTFRENLYNSLDLAMKNKNINYIPGCAELGDFDATSTTISLTPCNELKNLPKPQVYNTFDRYYNYFSHRKANTFDWVNYTPYENRLIGSFILLDQPERAHDLIEYFLNDQNPQGWNHWAEVVWKDHSFPGFIGDMPHTWVGSDFLNAIRSMFVYENEYDQSLVLAAALYQDWIDAPEGMSIEHLPTYYGEISYSIKKENSGYKFIISGDVKLPENGMKIRNFNGSKLPRKITINGIETKDFTNKEITVKTIPAEVLIQY